MNGQIAEWRVARAFSLQLPAARQRRVLREVAPYPRHQLRERLFLARDSDARPTCRVGKGSLRRSTAFRRTRLHQ